MSQENIRIENGVFEGCGKKIPLLSGEFHYWRNNAENWESILDSIKELGIQIVSTYIPWNFHEISPGEYDFEGKTSAQRDLKGFIELTIAKGLYLIVRPGPYIYAEWPFGGVPERASKYHRLDPEFLKMAGDYLLNVCRLLSAYQITQGGNIILVQVDNEPYPSVESFGEDLGCFGKGAITGFKQWLKEKYNGDIELLNRKWKDNYKSFDEPCLFFHEPYVNVNLPMADRLLPHPDYYFRYADSMEFIGWYGAEIVLAIKESLREAGIEVPLYVNGWSPLFQDFRRLSGTVDMVGVDISPYGEYMQGERITEDEWLYIIDIAKLTNADTGYLWSAELQSGIPPSKQCYLPPGHFKYFPLVLMAYGLKGWNWYMLVNRDSRYNSPVDEWGRRNEYYPIHKEVVEIAEKVRPWDLEPVYDVDLFIYKPHRVIAPGNFKQTFYSLQDANVNFKYYNPRDDGLPQTDYLIYCGSGWIEEQVGEKLAEYVENGGTLIAFNQFPMDNEFGNKLESLQCIRPDGARPVTLPVTIEYRGESISIDNAGHMGCKVNFFYYDKVEGEPISLTLSTAGREVLVDIGAQKSTRFIIGYEKKMGQGKIIHLGSNPTAGLIKFLLKGRKESQAVKVDTGGVLASISKNKNNGESILFVINRDAHLKDINITLSLSRLNIDENGSYTLEDLTKSTKKILPGRELADFYVKVDGFEVGIWKIIPGTK